ncbi:MAG: hypothetical protein PHU64_01270 [Candidatus Omnitrophica bacterium]|nr:hypothetical protein [Candidatus Omnitrophota bacterium]MDD5429109.1 hypothetical protein [Candidatus Omnitrophota bacterium]
MIKKTLLLVLVNVRKESAAKVQKILTDWGCIIKTRLGIHDGVLDDCTNSGLIILELVGSDNQAQEINHKLNLLAGVKSEIVELQLPKD